MTTSNHGNDQRPRNRRGRFVRQVDNALRDIEAVKLRVQGRSYAQIAAELGYADRGNAYRAVEAVLAATAGEPAAELRALEVARLDEMQQRAWAVLERTHVTVSQGRVVKDDDGEPILDDAPVLNAIDRLLKIAERRAKLLGLDAPTKVEAITVDMLDSEIARLTQELGTLAPDQPGGDE